MPPVDRVFIITAWLGSIFYGINCVLFGTCMYILLNRNRRAHRIILVSCIFHFSMATADNILCLLRALQAFTNPAIISTPNGSSEYLLKVTALSMTNWGLYIFNTLALNFLLIWRLYVVWKCVWILIVMLTLQAAYIGTSVTTWSLVLRSGVIFLFGVREFGNACFAFNLAVTIGLTSGISYRLLRAGRTVSDLTGHNAYKAAMYTVIESGALYTCSFVVYTGLMISGSIVGVMAMGISIQITALVPLLLIVRLGLGLTHGESTCSETLSAAGSSFTRPIQVKITEEICTSPIDMDSSPRYTCKSVLSYPNSSANDTG